MRDVNITCVIGITFLFNFKDSKQEMQESKERSHFFFNIAYIVHCMYVDKERKREACK